MYNFEVSLIILAIAALGMAITMLKINTTGSQIIKILLGIFVVVAAICGLCFVLVVVDVLYEYSPHNGYALVMGLVVLGLGIAVLLGLSLDRNR